MKKKRCLDGGKFMVFCSALPQLLPGIALPGVRREHPNSPRMKVAK